MSSVKNSNLRGIDLSFRPSPGRGVQSNLSQYREYTVWGKPVFDNWSLAFDIERTVQWDNEGNVLESEYGMMAVGYYGLRGLKHARQRQSEALHAGFVERIAPLNGFTKHSADPAKYDDKRANLRACIRESGRVLTIAVIPMHNVERLETVIDTIAPQAVAVFNHLNPTKPVPEGTVNGSVLIARQSDAIMNTAGIGQALN
jgi:hypothetical protein